MCSEHNGVWGKFTSKLRPYFPDIPYSFREAYPGLFAAWFVLILMMVINFVEPLKNKLLFAALYFQFIGSALLWWEANAREAIVLVVDDFRKRRPRPPKTRAEWITNRIVQLFIIFCFAALFLALAVLVIAKTAASGAETLMWGLFKLACFMAAAISLSYGAASLLDKQLGKVAHRIAKADIKENQPEAERIVRRALRTIGFAVITVGTFLQAPPIWME